MCDALAEQVGTSPYETDSATWVDAPVLECRTCDIYFRVLDDNTRKQHFRSASYVQLDRERAIWNERHGFLSYILDLTEHRLGKSGAKLLDIGCSYGHLLELAVKNGFHSEGVEINQDLVAYCLRRGLVVWTSIESASQPVDAITLIDSLYYVPRPVEFMRELGRALSPAGVVVLRVTNRNWLIQAKAAMLGIYDFRPLGDAEISYSVHGICRLLRRAGLVTTDILPDSGRGKCMKLKQRLIYASTCAATNMTLRNLYVSPGIIVIARPS